jgi:hypothetical protein
LTAAGLQERIARPQGRDIAVKLLLHRLVLGGLAACPAFAVFALPPDQVFERASPGIWALRILDQNGQPSKIGSAVAIAAGKAVTSCSLLSQGGRYALQREKTVVPARLEFSDSERDLCQLDAPGLQAQEPARGVARIGQRVYAIAFERGVEITISEGLISRLRDAGTDAERVQTSVPTSGWLLGGGLYDDEARLLGIVTMPARDVPGAVNVVPARWIAEIADRATMSAAAAVARAGSTLPAPGAQWSYIYASRGLGATRFDFTVRVNAIEGSILQESLAIAGGPARQAPAGLESLVFRTSPLPRSQTLVEFAPYLHVLLAKHESIRWGTIAGYPAGNAAMPFWNLTATNQGVEQVAVPAGTFRATMIEVLGRRQAPAMGVTSALVYESTRFRYRAWYVPEVRRYVKLQHETWGLRGDWSGEQTIELISYSDK